VPYTAYRNVSYEVTEYQKEERQKQIPYTVTEYRTEQKQQPSETGCIHGVHHPAAHSADPSEEGAQGSRFLSIWQIRQSVPMNILN
jgi:hypothetical protein